MRLAGIIGHPVAHSLSPVFQQAAFEACGLDARYERWDTPAEALAGRLVSLRDPKYLGANVTIPHKEAVIPLLDELGGQAAPGALFVDIVYAPAHTAWLQAARAAGVRTLGGLPMLIYQGALAFELWTGVHAPVETMFEAARKALAARGTP